MKSVEFLKRSNDLIRTEVKIDGLEHSLFSLKILAWKKLSEEGKVDSKYSFNTFLKEGKSNEDFLEIISFFLKEDNPKIFSDEDFELVRNLSSNTFISLITMARNVDDYTVVVDILPNVPARDLKFENILPKELIDLQIKLLKSNSFNNVYNPYPGVYQFAFYISREFNIPVYTEGLKKTTLPYLINVLNDVDINPSFSDPINNPIFKEGHKLKEFDISVSFPPFNMRELIQPDIYGRFRVTKEGKGILDIAIIEHLLSQTKDKIYIYTSVGFLFRNSKTEKELKELLINEGYIEAVILLPENLLLNTSIPVSLMVLNKSKESEDVLFIDASKLYERASKGRKNILKDVDKIVKTINNRKEIEGFSYIAPIEEIKENDYVLHPERYVLTKEKKEIEKLLKSFHLTELKNIAKVINSPVIKRKEGKSEVYEVQISDIPEEGIVKNVKTIRKVGIKPEELKESSIQDYDVLIGIKGSVGKVGIVIGKPKEQIWIPAQSLAIIRAPEKEQAVALYMFFKSKLGQYLLNTIKKGNIIENVSIKSLLNLEIPKFTKEQIKKSNQIFEEELKTYQEIEERKKKLKQINENFINQLKEGF
ncbi:N-6 DNA methylase [Persephonella sp.]